MALSPPLRQAVRRWGPSVQGVAHQYGISGEALLAKLIQGESGGRADRTSKAGAQGYTQFMPGTRRISIDRYGVDPLAGADQAVHAAALHLRGKLTGSKGLEGYNPGGGRGYVDYILNQRVGHVGGRSGSGGASASGDSGGLAGRLTGSVTPGQVTGGGFDPGTAPDVSSLADLLSKPQPQAPQLPAAPFSTSKYLHMGQSPVVTPQAPQGGLEDALAAIQSSGQEIPQTSVSAAQTSVSGSANGGPTATASRAGTGRSPTARSGKLIGFPYQGTHTLGNWQSDRAVDIAVPIGTPMVALQDGVVEKVTRHPQSAGRFAGDQITIRGANGNEYFYAHGVAHVQAGQKIHKGQSLGTTGSANGIAHLHYAQKHGDVYQHVRSR